MESPNQLVANGDFDLVSEYIYNFIFIEIKESIEA
jgi:hypothetical protein